MWACTRSARWCHTGRMPSSLFWIRNAASASVSWMYVRQRFLGAPVIHVRAQHVAALAPARPVVPLGLRPPLQPHAGAQRRIGHELDDVAASRALVAFEEPAELAFQAARRNSISAARPDLRARSNADAKSAVRSQVSPCNP